jgi:hypothetical protein
MMMRPYLLFCLMICLGALRVGAQTDSGARAQTEASSRSEARPQTDASSGSEVKPQTDSLLRLVRQMPLAATDFAVDNLGGLYAITLDNQLKKFNGNGDSVGLFDEVKKYGSLSGIDVTNPLKILLFYKDFMTVLALDNFLNRLYKVDLRQAGVYQSATITTSYDNNFWVFDEQNAQLKKMNDQGQAVMTSNDFRQLFGEAVAPQEIVDQGGLVYLNDPTQGIYIFDYYGGFKVKLSFKGVSGLKVFGKNIYGIRDNELFTYKPGTLQEQHLHLPFSVKDADRIQIVLNGLYVLRGRVLYYYSVR